MLRQISKIALSLLAIFALVACAPTGSNAPMEIRSGVIEQINSAQIKSSHETGVGAVVGGLGGLGIGALIGAGTGKTVAMVLGAIGGAVAGNEIQKHYDKPVEGQQIFVRTSGGVLVSVTQPTSNLRVGQKVYIEGSGTEARVIPQ